MLSNSSVAYRHFWSTILRARDEQMSHTIAERPSRVIPEPTTDHVIHQLPIVVLFPHNRCNCRCVMCDIWRIRQVREITRKDLEPHLDALLALQVRWVVLSGGEPQLASDFLDQAP